MAKKKILVIEDEETCIKLLDMVVNKDTYDVIVATNGEEGIRKAIEAKPDLIFLDIMLPKVNGFEVAKRLRQDETLKSSPIIVISARAGKEGAQKALDAGCQEFIAKPFKVGQIRDVIHRYIQ